MARARGRRGLERLERAIELHFGGSAGTRSAKEVLRPLAALARGRAESALVNTKIEVDVHWPASGLVPVEIDGGNHERPSQRGEDERRDAALRAAGTRSSG